MSGSNQRDKRRYRGIPVGAWASGLALGLVIGYLLFDGWIVGAIFGVSIGTAFAIAFHQSDKDDRPASSGRTETPDSPPS